MSLIAKLFIGDGKETVLDVEEKLDTLDKEEAVARRAIEVASTRRNALLISGDDAGLDADARTIEEANRTIERAVLARQALNERLTAARARARNATIDEFRRERVGILAELVDAIEAAIEANERAQAFTDRVRASLGDGHIDGVSDIIAHPLFRRSLLEVYRAHIAQLSGPVRRQATPAPAGVVKKIASAVSAVAAAASPAKPKRPKKVPAAATAGEGLTRVFFYRSGIELPDGTLSSAGDIVDLPAHQALALLNRGVADVVRDASRPAEGPSASATEGSL